MSDFLYIDHTGKQWGPVTADQLRQLIQRGALHPDAPVWRAGMTAWAPARAVPGVLPSAIQPQPVLATPPQQSVAPGGNVPSKRTRVALIVAGVGGLALALILLVVLLAGGKGGALAGGAGPQEPPQQLAGHWSGQLHPDFSQTPQLQGFANHPNLRGGVQFDFQCTPDGRVTWGLLGQFAPVELHAGLVRQQLLATQPNTKALLTEFSTTADTCRFTIHQASERDVIWNGPGTDIEVHNARKTTLTVTARRVGEEVAAEFILRESIDGTPLTTVPFKGRLQRR